MAKQVTRWEDASGYHHLTEADAIVADGRIQAHEIIREAVSGYDSDIDMTVIENRAEDLIAALKLMKGVA